ncbi:TPA: hypothetical protein ACK3JH_000191 [Mannheimia haemolytica]
MKTNLFTVFATLALSATVATTSQAKIGDTFIDPEYGKITVKSPAFENDNGTNYTYTKGQKQFYDTPERIFLHKKITPVSHLIDNAVKKSIPT